jgi:hypothetical protein
MECHQCSSQVKSADPSSSPRINSLFRNLSDCISLPIPSRRNRASASAPNNALSRHCLRPYSWHHHRLSCLQERFPILEHHFPSSHSGSSRCLYYTLLSIVQSPSPSYADDGSEAYIYGEYVLGSVLMALGLSLGVYGGFVMDCVFTICDYLDINCLTVKKKKSI